MPLPLVKLRPTSVNPDVPAAELGEEVWSACQNFTFVNGFANRVKGWVPIFPEIPTIGSDYPLHILNARQTGVENYWIAVCTNSVWVTNGGSPWVDITPVSYLAVADASQITSCSLNGIPVMNTGVVTPFYWPIGAAQCEPLPGWTDGDLCGFIDSFKFHLVAGNISTATESFPSELRWSDAAAPANVPSNWLPSPVSDAGFTTLGATRGAIIHGAKLRGDYMIYKDHSAYRMSYQGGSFVMSIRKFLSNTGILSRNCIAEVEGYHVILGDGDVWRTDGQNVTSILDRRMKHYLFSLISSENYEQAYLALNRRNSEVLICFMQEGETVPSTAIVWEYNRDVLGVRDIGIAPAMAYGTVTEQDAAETWDAPYYQNTSWDQIPVGNLWGVAQYQAADDGLIITQTLDKQLYQFDQGSTENGSFISANVDKTQVDFGMPEERKTVTRVWPRVTVPSGGNPFIFLQMAATDSPNDRITWGKTHLFAPNRTGPNDDHLDVFYSGRYIHFRFQVNGARSEPFQLEGFDVELSAPRGRF
jgi:hypothetical protein